MNLGDTHHVCEPPKYCTAPSVNRAVLVGEISSAHPLAATDALEAL